MYCIVETLERTGPVVSAVPSNWIIKNNLYWPDGLNAKGSKLKKLRESRATPTSSWISMSVNRILFNNIRKSFS